MNPSVFQCGHYLIRTAADATRALSAWPDSAAAPDAIKRPAAFFTKLSEGYLLVADSGVHIDCDPAALARLLTITRDTGAGIVYSDFYDRDNHRISAHPLTDYQEGSIRDDFNFGRFYIFSAAAISKALAQYGGLPNDPDTVLYDLRLKISMNHSLIHVPEFLYTASARKLLSLKETGKKTETQFDYVSRNNFTRQKKFEKIAANHLKLIGAYLPPPVKTTSREPEESLWKASVVIPVLNRKKTIADALKSALSQKTDFPFNIIVVDNHSTDGTTDLLKTFAARYPHVHHVIPRSRNLGIGGCWNEAIYSPFCGRYVVQLDSDDLYSSPHTLRKIVNTLRKGSYAMVVGSYTLVNEKLTPIEPGLIDHREWTRANGHNNLLRVNGMGAPRAFDATILRKFGFPNVSYGEDYAVALRMAREYKIGRIYESLYLCRRWKDNTDASLSVERQNQNDYYKDKLRTLEIKARQQLKAAEGIFAGYPEKSGLTLPDLCRNFFASQKQSWPALADACRDLSGAKTRDVDCGDYSVTLQYNPARAISGGAAVDPESIRRRPCFLCKENRPADQKAIVYRNAFLLLCNPAPIFDRHFTVVSRDHRRQEISSSLDSFLKIARDAAPEYAVLYNGPACGASAPDHLHFQMIPSAALPFLDRLHNLPMPRKASSVRFSTRSDFDRTFVILESEDVDAVSHQMLNLLHTAQKILATTDEPPVNVFCVHHEDSYRLVVFLRGKHRPDAYYAEGEERLFVSPGAIDMAGTIITPCLADYERLAAETLRGIYREVSLDPSRFDRIIRKWGSLNES